MEFDDKKLNEGGVKDAPKFTSASKKNKIQRLEQLRYEPEENQ